MDVSCAVFVQAALIIACRSLQVVLQVLDDCSTCRKGDINLGPQAFWCAHDILVSCPDFHCRQLEFMRSCVSMVQGDCRHL